MKKRYLILIIAFTIFIIGCNVNPQITVIHPEVYEVEIYNNEIIKGEDLIKKFYFNTQNNKELILEIKYTITLEKDKVSSEYYEENKKDYPKEECIYIYYDQEKYIYEKDNTKLTYLYMKMESTKENEEIIPTSDYAYFLTNDKNMTFDDYIRLLAKPDPTIALDITIKILYVKSINETITFGESEISSIYYYKNQSEIIITESLEKMLFEYLDSLEWKPLGLLTKEETGKIESHQQNNNSILIISRRVYKNSKYDSLFFTKDKENMVQYRLYLDGGYVYLSNGLFSTNSHDLYANLDAFELAQILYKSDIDTHNKINNTSYINPIKEGYSDCRCLTLFNDSAFMYYEGSIYSTMLHGNYYVIGNNLVLLFSYPVGIDTISYKEEYVLYEIKDDKLIFIEGNVLTVFGKGLMGDLIIE